MALRTDEDIQVTDTSDIFTLKAGGQISKVIETCQNSPQPRFQTLLRSNFSRSKEPCEQALSHFEEDPTIGTVCAPTLPLLWKSLRIYLPR